MSKPDVSALLGRLGQRVAHQFGAMRWKLLGTQDPDEARHFLVARDANAMRNLSHELLHLYWLYLGTQKKVVRLVAEQQGEKSDARVIADRRLAQDEDKRVAFETAALLLSSYTCMLSFAATNAKNLFWTQFFLLLTGLLGLVFVGLELQEFIELGLRGITPQRSGMLTAFFGLVGLHGVHVTLGGMWLATMMAQVLIKGFRREIVYRLICFNLFWHALDIVWIGIFTIVYLIGSGT